MKHRKNDWVIKMVFRLLTWKEYCNKIFPWLMPWKGLFVSQSWYVDWLGNDWMFKGETVILDGHRSYIPIEFMWICWQHCIRLLYLLAYSSHILQPLDLAPFSVLKSAYRDQIRALSLIDDAAPVKKERYIYSYNQARIVGLSERVIRAGWRATGLVPYNPDSYTTIIISNIYTPKDPTSSYTTCR